MCRTKHFRGNRDFQGGKKSRDVYLKVTSNRGLEDHQMNKQAPKHDRSTRNKENRRNVAHIGNVKYNISMQ